MNIYGYKLKLKKARDMLENTEQELSNERRKRGRRDYDEIERLTDLIKGIRLGQQNLRNKIRILKQGRKKKKSK